MEMTQDSRKVKSYDLSSALFAQKAQKRTAVEFYNHKPVNHFISLPEITYSVTFEENSGSGKFDFYSLLIAHVKDGIPMYLPIHNVSENGIACFGEKLGTRLKFQKEFRSVGEMAEFAVSEFWNSGFDWSFEAMRLSHYGGTPLANFKSWAKYTKEHPDWIPEPNVPIDISNRVFFARSEAETEIPRKVKR